ncbi:MAG: hypothetical protein KDB24_05915 [Microthrixaceae bacterium]|nr:hypothetical protein [Microthrixaceae bacterium]
MSTTEAPEVLSRARLTGRPWPARATRGVVGASMIGGSMALPWLGPALRPGPGITYAAEIPALAMCALGCGLVVLWGRTRPDAPPTSPHDPPVPRSRSVAVAALAGTGLVLATNLIAELLSAIAIGRSALEVVDAEPVRLLPGPGQLLFALGCGAALMSGAGRPPMLTIQTWVREGRLGTLRGWLVVTGICLVAFARSDVWLQANPYTLTGAEVPFLGQLLGVLVAGLAVAGIWVMVRGGVLARLLGGAFGITLALLATGTILLSGFIVGLVPTDALEQRAIDLAPGGLGDQAVHTTAEHLRHAGAGTGPILALIGVAAMTAGAALPSRRRAGSHSGTPAPPPPPPLRDASGPNG